jgi:hypothetical protein
MAKHLPLPCQTKLNLLLSYTKETGELRWRKSARPGYSAGDIAGCVPNGKPYRIVVIEGQGYYAQRLIWKMVTGRDPVSVIDHKDLDCSNNKWENLRPAGHPQNGYNRKLNADNTSGVKGVTWEKSHKAWKAVITVDKKSIRLGRFKKLSDAEFAISIARERLHGDFARAA